MPFVILLSTIPMRSYGPKITPIRPQATCIPKMTLSGRQLKLTLVTKAEPTKEQIETAIKQAEEACESGSTEECATSWDTVEELSAAAADKKLQGGSKDPLEEFCKDNPETDECRVYED
eukprot:TRINITY_DN2047_c0_g1_i1.p2 TRINITY_DN2047_c0_g1~~TRINITY_DN2047_c0_g1_i1.p2  ORF type:complete len:119 (-),score=14.04 TRINITY_DN2047_c0_g1_i1:250-606(-)